MDEHGRFRLLLTVDGTPVLRSWWASEAVARHHLMLWIRDRDALRGARITLTDEQTGAVLTEWSTQQPGSASLKPAGR